MRILHIVGGDLTKGAFLGAYWLHRGLLNIGVESKILGFIPSHQTRSDISATSTSGIGKLFDKAIPHLDRIWLIPYRNRSRNGFNTGFFGRDVSRHRFFRSADVINIHWFSNGVTSQRHIGKFQKPTVLTVRDMWPFTGGCHYAMGCERYMTGCGRCPQLGSPIKWDLSRMVSASKKKHLGNTILVGISDWIASCAKQSSVFSNNRVITIPNCVDTEAFFPTDASVARELLNVSTDIPVVLVGAGNLGSFYKGWPLFIEAVAHVSDKQQIQLLTFGTVNEDFSLPEHWQVKHLGYLSDPISLRIAYSAADVFVAPSVQEAFGKTIVESMSCGTPVVCFDATGPGYIVEHLKTGYKANPFSADQLSKGIDWVLHQGDPEKLHNACTIRARETFSKEVVARQYQKLYRDLV